MERKLRGLFLNTPKDICSIYESGKMCYDCLVQSDNYSLDYVEVSTNNSEILAGFDFYLFNYHWVKMGWLDTTRVKSLPGFKATIVLEMSQNYPFDCVSKDDFDAYIVLDPTCKYFLTNVYAFPRPLETNVSLAPHVQKEVPVIGTFGLSFADKGFDEVVKATNKEFDQAIVRINVPKSENVTPDAFVEFNNKVSSMNLKKGIKIELTDHYFDKTQLIEWCAQNTLNVFLYNRRVGNGLSATTDQAIASGRPLAVSTNPTFRHIHSYITPYPYLSLKEAMYTTEGVVRKIQQDWSSQQFVLKFESVLAERVNIAKTIQEVSRIQLPVIFTASPSAKFGYKSRIKKILRDFIPPIVFKVQHKLIARKKEKNYESLVPAAPADTLRPYAHQILKSNSQFYEDLLIDLLLNKKREGVYVDIGANDPFLNSNTNRFYSRGWRGINIEPGFAEYKKIARFREGDINLNMAVSEVDGELTFYKIGNDSSLSTLDHKTAVKMAEMYNLELTSHTVNSMPIFKILDTYFKGRTIDFMSVDAEGHDLVVLKSNDWNKYRPTLVMVESNIDSMDIIRFMDQQNYLYIFSNHINAIFVDKTTHDAEVLSNISWGN